MSSRNAARVAIPNDRCRNRAICVELVSKLPAVAPALVTALPLLDLFPMKLKKVRDLFDE